MEGIYELAEYLEKLDRKIEEFKKAFDKTDFFNRLREIDGILGPEHNDEWSVIVSEAICGFGNSPEEALAEAEKLKGWG